MSYTLNPLDFLLPLAFSNFLPLDLTYGLNIRYLIYLVVESGTPGALPKCKIASLILDPLSKVTY